MNVLVLNCSSSATKFAVVHASDGHVHEFDHEGRLEARTVPGEGTAVSLRATFQLHGSSASRTA